MSSLTSTFKTFSVFSLPSNAVSAFPRALSFLLAPLLLLFSSIGIYSLKSASEPALLAIFAILALSAVVRFRLIGLCGAFLALMGSIVYLYDGIAPSDRLWHMGLFFSALINCYLMLLGIEEAESIFSTISQEVDLQRQQVCSIRAEQEETKSLYDEDRRALEEEITRLKEEAEQRKIDRSQLEKNMALLVAEVESTLKMKENLIEEARCAREQSLQRLTRLEEEQAEKNRLMQQVNGLEELNKELRAESSFLMQKFEEEKSSLADAIQTSNRQISALENEVVGLKVMRDSSLETERGLAEQLSIAVTLAEQKYAQLENEKQRLEEELPELSTAKIELEKRVEELKQAHAIATAQVKELQEQLQQAMHSASQFSAEEAATISREKQIAMGLYNQLRGQFDEKSKVLSRTRQELFALEGKLLAKEIEHRDARLSGDFLDATLQKEMSLILEENAQLETEINALEALISHILSR